MFRDSNKANQAWTDEEDRRLLEMRAAGRSSVSIGNALKRSAKPLLRVLHCSVREDAGRTQATPVRSRKSRCLVACINCCFRMKLALRDFQIADQLAEAINCLLVGD